MQVHEEYTVWRGENLFGFVRCTDAGWEASKDGTTWDARHATTAQQAIRLPRDDYRLTP